MGNREARRRTLWRIEEVEKGVGLDGLGEDPLGAPVLVLLYLLHQLHRHILALFPVYLGAAVASGIGGVIVTAREMTPWILS